MTDEELKSKCAKLRTVAMVKIAGVKSNDKINFKEFVDFFYKADWWISKYIIVLFIKPLSVLN